MNIFNSIFVLVFSSFAFCNGQGRIPFIEYQDTQASFPQQNIGDTRLSLGILEVLRRVESNRRLIAFEPGCKLADEDQTEVRCGEDAVIDFDQLYTVDSIYKFVCRRCQIVGNKLDSAFCRFAGTSNYGLHSAVFYHTNLTLIDENTFNCTDADKTVVRFVITGTETDSLKLGHRICGPMAQFDLLWIQSVRHITFETDTFQDCSLRSLLIDYADLATSNFDPRDLLSMRKVPAAIKFKFVRLDTVGIIWNELFRRSELDNGCIADFDLGGGGSVSIRCDQRLAWIKEFNDMENRLKLGNASCRYPPELVGRHVSDLRWERLVVIPTPPPDREPDRTIYGPDP